MNLKSKQICSPAAELQIEGSGEKMDVPEEFDELPIQGAAIAINFLKGSETIKPNSNYQRSEMSVSPI